MRTSSHRCGHHRCGIKTSVKSLTLRQSGKSSLNSWPDVKLIPQTKKQTKLVQRASGRFHLDAFGRHLDGRESPGGSGVGASDGAPW